MRSTRPGSAPAGCAIIAGVLVVAAALVFHGLSLAGFPRQALAARGLTVVLNVHQHPAGTGPNQSITLPHQDQHSHTTEPLPIGALTPEGLSPTQSTSLLSSPKSKPHKKVTIIPPSQNCTCSADLSLKCVGTKAHLIEEAVQTVCPMKADIRDVRRISHCVVEAVNKAMGWARPPPVPRSADIVQEGECPDHLLEDSFSEQPKKRQLELVHKARRQLAAASLISAIASASATMDLWWKTGQEDMFYDQNNMWWMRGWDKGRRHIDPFTKWSKPFVPEKAPKADRQQWGSCAIVGNSGGLMKHRLGDEISSHDTVIRVNQGPLHEDYHDHIGNRTDVRILNRKITEMYATNANYHEHLLQDINTTVIATRAATWAFDKLGKRIQQDHPDKRLLFSTGAVVGHGYGMLASFRAGFEEATGIKFRGGNSPSSGLVAIMIASQMCSKVSAYGFALGNCLRGCPRYHYWTKGKGQDGNPGTAYKGHQYDVEGWLMKVRQCPRNDASLCALCLCLCQLVGHISCSEKWSLCALHKALHVMGHVRVAPQPPKYLPAYDSRLAGLLSPEGRFTDKTVLRKQKSLLNANVFLDTVLGGTTGNQKKTDNVEDKGQKPVVPRGKRTRGRLGRGR